jgi:hypothetical protein
MALHFTHPALLVSPGLNFARASLSTGEKQKVASEASAFTILKPAQEILAFSVKRPLFPGLLALQQPQFARSTGGAVHGFAQQSLDGFKRTLNQNGTSEHKCPVCRFGWSFFAIECAL